MNLSKGNKIVSDFRTIISEKFGLIVKQSPISRNIIEVTGTTKYLLYLKARSDYPLRWGVTANVLDRLRRQEKPWAVVLLFLEPSKGYLLTSEDVEYYIKNIWAKGRDGDFKPSIGSYLGNNKAFYSIDEFLNQFHNIAHSS